MTDWHSFSLEGVYKKLSTSESGLTKFGYEERLEKFGFNELPEQKPDSVFKIFFSQFKSPLIYILLLCSLTVIFLKEVVDGLIILGVIILNSIIGTIQEGRAQNTLLALKKFTETSATVLRDGKELIVSDRELVPGDVIVVQEGEKIPADARIIYSNNLKIDEASITGESVPIFKSANEVFDSSVPVHSQKNMLFKGTNIVSGHGKAVIVETGINTFVGKIAKQISAIDTEIPLKKDVKKLSNGIIAIVGVVSLLIFIFGILKGYDTTEIFITVVSLAVSVIPEGLPIVITLVLATGVWRMSKKNVLVKKLQAVEALGQASIIAVDKTGTITKNEMIVSKVFISDKTYEITGEGYDIKGEIFFDNNVVSPLNHADLMSLAKITTLASGAHVSFDEKQNIWKVSGDPTEAAMLIFGEKVGFKRDDLLNESNILSEIPFSFDLKYHAIVHKEENQKQLAVVGAPEVIFGLCKMSSKDKDKFNKKFIEMSQDGLRVLAVAYKQNFKLGLSTESVKALSFLGLVAMKDTIRHEAIEAVQKAKNAGIKVVMITGDHKITASAIAREAGIFSDGDEVLTGEELEKLSKKEIAKILPRVSVFARITPENKSKIINIYKNNGDVVAMTGDGVNDAPSLVAADLGVSMGKIGTEVAKEASDIVLMDDNFGSIVSGVEEGRGIYKTIKRVILYLFSTSAGEMLTIIVALFVLDLPLPILAVQIIWLNLVTDGFLDIALSMEPKSKNLLYGKFDKSKKSLVDKLMITRIIFMSLPMMLGTLYFFNQYFENDIEKAWTISLTVLAMFQWFNAWNCRSETKSVFVMNPFSNKYLIGATGIVVLLQIFAVYNPIMQTVLKTVPLSLNEWLIMLPVAVSVILFEEVRKLGYRILLNFRYKKVS